MPDTGFVKPIVYASDDTGFSSVELDPNGIPLLAGIPEYTADNAMGICEPRCLGIIRDEIPDIPSYAIHHADKVLTLLDALGLLPAGITHVLVANIGSDEHIERLLDAGATTLWDGAYDAYTASPRPYADIAMPHGDVIISPGCHFTYTGPIPQALSRSISLELRTRARDHLRDEVASPFQWGIQHADDDGWGLSWDETDQLDANVLSFGIYDESGFDFIEREQPKPSFKGNILFFAIDYGNFLASTRENAESDEYARICLALARIWKHFSYQVNDYPQQWDDLVAEAIAELSRFQDDDDRFPKLVANIGRKLGVDYAVESYFNGVPLEAIIGDDACGNEPIFFR